MPKQVDRRQRRTEESRERFRGESSLPRRWTSVVVVVACLAVGLVLLERLSRPVSRPEENHAVPQAAPSEKRTSPPASYAAPATDQELITQTKKVGDRLVEDFPDDPAAITLAGHICWALDEPTRAVATWTKCTESHPDFSPGWAALGMDALKKGDFGKAAQCYEHAYRLTPKMAEGDLFMMVGALMNAGKPEKVVAVLEPLRKTQPNSIRAVVALGQAYLHLKEYEKAKKELLSAVAMDPRSANVHFALAQVFARLGDEANARKHQEEYAKLKSAEIASSDGVRADRLKADLVDLRPHAARLLTWTAKIYAFHDRLDVAEQLWGTSLAVDPTNAETRGLLGMLYSSQGRGEEASEVTRGKGRAPAPARKE
jgi:cytochrome c-type biogenesis protein CcmH/NrfG